MSGSPSCTNNENRSTWQCKNCQRSQGVYAGVRQRVYFFYHQWRYLKFVFFLEFPLIIIASEKCQQEKRKTVNGEDILFAMTSLGFENYAEALKIYLSKYREVSFTPCFHFSHPILSSIPIYIDTNGILDPISSWWKSRSSSFSTWLHLWPYQPGRFRTPWVAVRRWLRPGWRWTKRARWCWWSRSQWS